MHTHTGNRMFGPPPPWFDSQLLPQLTHEQIACWDECHIEQQGGKVGDRAYQYSFKRDENGKLSKTGTYQDASLTKTSFKFPKQARFSFGVATSRPLGTTEPVGKHLEMYDYTGKNIVTREVYAKHMKEECDRVKKLKGKCLPWYENMQPKGEIWMEDSIKEKKGAGATKGDRLVEVGIKQVKDIKQKMHDELLTLSQNISGVS